MSSEIEQKCPKCGSGLRTRNSVFRYYLCGSHEGAEFHQSGRCRALVEGRETADLRVSGCCGAELNYAHVIEDGPHKGHGPRLCSKCGKVAYIV